MTVLFLVIAGVMILAAFLCVLPPLWKKRPIKTIDQDQRNISIAKQRWSELKDQLQAGTLSPSLYDEQLSELEQALSDDLDLTPVSAPCLLSSDKGRWMAAVLMVAIPLLSGSLYWTLGNYQSLNQTATTTTPEQQQMLSMVAGLAKRLETQPDDALGWTMLGRSYQYLQQLDKAVPAFAHAYQLLGDQPEIMLLYADTLAAVNDGQLTGKPAELVFKALAKEPENITGLWLGGMAKAQDGDFSSAMALWKKLEPLLPQGSEGQLEIQDLMAKLATQMPQETKAAPALTQVTINVQVSLAPKLQKLADPNDTVFIYAKALSGVNMPLAILRKRVSELPITLTLTDAQAMTPELKLSNFKQVKLLARVSKSGNAMPQPGDLIGTLDSVAVTDNSLKKITINTTVK